MLSASLNKTFPSFFPLHLQIRSLKASSAMDANPVPASPLAYDLETTVTTRERERERNVLFNDALNTFYLRLYGVRHMVKDHSDSEKGNPLPPHRLLLSINSKGSFICTIPQTG